MINIRKYLIIITLVFMSSCENPVDIVDDSLNYLPLEPGNFWVFETYELDIHSKPISGTLVSDSMFVVSKMNVMGSEAYFLEHYRDSELFDSIYISRKSDMIYRLYDEKLINIPGFRTQWLLIGNLGIGSAYNHVYDTSFNDHIMKLDNVEYSSYAEYAINLSRHFQNDSVQYDGMKLPGIGFDFRIDRRFSFEYIYNNNLDTSNVSETRLKYDRVKFLKGIGFMEFETLPYQDKYHTDPHVDGFPGTTRNYNGSISILTSYHLE